MAGSYPTLRFPVRGRRPVPIANPARVRRCFAHRELGIRSAERAPERTSLTTSWSESQVRAIFAAGDGLDGFGAPVWENIEIRDACHEQLESVGHTLVEMAELVGQALSRAPGRCWRLICPRPRR